MDPTGMFRNRGRRVVAGSRSGANNAGAASPREFSSPPKSSYRRRRNHDLPPMMSNGNNHFNGQQNELQRKRNFRTRQEYVNATSSTEASEPPKNSQPKISEDLIQFDSTPADQLQQPYPLQSSKKIFTKISESNNMIMLMENNGSDDSKNHVEHMMKQDEPEMDHPPQSSLHAIGNSNSGGLTMQIDVSKQHGRKSPSYNKIGSQKYNDFDDENEDKLSDILLNGSHESVCSDHTRSTVGSTVSIMGSIVGEGSDHYDEARLSAVKRRMMQDVEEVVEEEGDDDDEEEAEEEERSNGDGSGNRSENGITQQHPETEETANTDDAVHDSNNDTLNVSLEVSFHNHNDTSFLDDRSMNVSLLDDQPMNTSFLNENQLVNTSFFNDNHPVHASSFFDDHAVNVLNVAIAEKADEDEKGIENDGQAVDNEGETVENEDNHRGAANVVKVADFSNPGSIDATVQHSICNCGDDGGADDGGSPPAKKAPGQESPFRAAFRRSAQGVGKSLPPLPSAVTPKRFDRASASSAIDRAASISSLLVGQCFSFEDTTLDDDDFLGAPDRFRNNARKNGEVGGGGRHHPSATTSHKYYGLSAVASHDDRDLEASTPAEAAHKGAPNADVEEAIPAFRGRRNAHAPRWQQHHHPMHTRSSSQPASPFRVIRHSQTWDHHGRLSPMRQQPANLYSKQNATYLNEGIRKTSSFDPWSPPAAGRGGRQVKPFRIDESSGLDHGEIKIDEVGDRDGGEKDWKKVETERGDAIDLLVCMVEQSLNFDAMGGEGSREFLCEKCQVKVKCENELNSRLVTCEDCLGKMKLIAKSVKTISANSHDYEQSFNGEVRSRAVDTLLRSHEFALELKRSSLSAKKWLETIEWRKNDNIVSDETDDEPNQLVDIVALRARLHTAENTLSSKDVEFRRLNDELSKCRAEIGRLRSSSRTQSVQRVDMSMSTHKSILSNSSSDNSTEQDYSTESSVERGGPLVLCSPRPAIKPTDSNDESFQNWEKNIVADMHLESRKEVLLLKAALENANRKIAALEKHETQKKEEPFPSEIEPIKSDDGESEQLFMKIAEDIEKEALDTSLMTQVDDSVNGDADAPAIKLDDPALEKELEEYREALITSLRLEENNGSRPRADSITSSDDPNLAQDLSKSNSSEAACSDRKMINVRMIDGENFSTEWGLDKALPPPPDHGLHSPIVEAILSKWTDDPGTRSALIRWMENILNGSNVVSTPSLKLSGLDHQIRDGFMMHVLPLLLRRKDVHVHLTSRAHRQTTYDIAVTVTPTSFSAHNNEDKISDAGSEDPELQHRHISRESKHHLMAFQATRSGASMKENHDAQTSPTKHKPPLTKPFLGRSIPDLVSSSSNAGSICTAITTPISNRTPSRGPQINGRNRYTSLSSEMKRRDNSSTNDQYAMSNLKSGASPSLGDDLSVGSSGDDDTDSKHSQRQSSIMGSISGALGLLSRRKPPAAGNEIPGAVSNNNDGHPSMFQTPKRDAIQSASKSSKEEEHPYHRVVSAPPGKIGITFVEYRGHAMVSNVSEESPLVGWVFPSDVLIAIDDVPVSGLRTRDIVKLLTNRVKQQRSLRMVSAVAMNELTRPGTV